MKRLFLTAMIPLFLAGCTGDGMNEMMGIGAVNTSKSTFDNSTVINMTPALLAVNGSTQPTQLGAMWSSALPGKVMLILSRDGMFSSDKFANISGLEVNVGGKVSRFAAPLSTSHKVGTATLGMIPTKSVNAVSIPLSLAKQMTTAPDVRLRVITDAGNEESIFSDAKGAGGGSTAVVPMRKFLAQIDAQRGSK